MKGGFEDKYQTNILNINSNFNNELLNNINNTLDKLTNINK